MIRWARVVAVHPQRRSLDLVMMDDGQPVSDVMVMGSAAGDSGSWDVPDVQPPDTAAEAGGLARTGQRRLIAGVIPGPQGRPVVAGFFQPPGGAVAFTEQNRVARRHPSGAYTTMAPDGSAELALPGGGYVRFGTGEHQALETIAGPGWAPPTGGAAAQVTVVTGAVKVVIEPGGRVSVTTTGELELTYGHATLKGDIALEGALTATGEVTAKGVKLSTHKHGGVQTGSGNTAAPTAG